MHIKGTCDDYIKPIYEYDKRKIKPLLKVLINSLRLNSERKDIILLKMNKMADHPRASYYRNKIARVNVNKDLTIRIID